MGGMEIALNPLGENAGMASRRKHCGNYMKRAGSCSTAPGAGGRGNSFSIGQPHSHLQRDVFQGSVGEAAGMRLLGRQGSLLDKSEERRVGLFLAAPQVLQKRFIEEIVCFEPHDERLTGQR